MRARWIGMAAVVGLIAGGPVLAQTSPLDGPLAAPDAPPPSPAPSAKMKPKKARKARHAAARPAGVPSPETPSAVPTADAAPPRREAPPDPLSLGMKWNGNNDTAGETRSQNLDGSSFGSGAEVGMKLHF